MTKVEIQVQNGIVTVTVGQASSAEKNSEPKAQENVPGLEKVIGGDIGIDPAHSGGSVSGKSGVVVIGPIVVETGGGETAKPGRAGGDIGIDSPHGGGVGSGSGSDCATVIGPIVIGCGGGGGGSREQPKKATAIDVGAEKEE